MRVGILTPHYFPSVRGNSITVQRIESGLRDQGVEVQVYSLETWTDAERLLAAVTTFRPDVVHGFHAYVASRLTVRAAASCGVPAVITVTGTDVNHDLFDPAHRPAVVEVLRHARAIVVFHEVMRQKVATEIPQVHAKVRVIGQAVRCEESPYDFRGRLGFALGDFIFFVPAGIRRVKNVLFCLPPLTRLQARYPRLKLVFVGPVIEEDEGERLKAAIADLPWAFSLGPVSHDEMCAMLHAVDVVINSSESEGGMANSILEAMSREVAVLASDIEGNRSVITDGEDGLLYSSEAEFEAKAERLLTDPSFTKGLGERARAKIERDFSWEGEIRDYLALYREVVGTGSPAG